jgi:tripartite-type tricarboxylate transporter receptor subunit TctC
VAKPLVEGKQIKCLAVTGTKRSPALPDVPTLAEQGIKHADVDLRFWFSVFAPKGLPADVIATLQKAIQTALADPALSERLKSLDITPEYGAASVLQARVLTDVKNWGAFIEAKGLKGQ